MIMNYSDIYAKNIPLFSGIAAKELANMLDCLHAVHAAYPSGDYILMAGEMTHHIGIMLSGRATVYKDDVLGNRSVITTLGPPDLFAETFVCAGLSQSPVTVEANSDCAVLKISINRILRPCTSSCAFHRTLIQNMLGIIARKNLVLSAKIDHISKKTTQQKLASYLLSEAASHGSKTFVIPLDRQALSEYLCVNRSALSREMSRLRSSGMLDYQKNRFAIKDKNKLEALLSE
jgi:CRP-like cAMP-binding protein